MHIKNVSPGRAIGIRTHTDSDGQPPSSSVAEIWQPRERKVAETQTRPVHQESPEIRHQAQAIAKLRAAGYQGDVTPRELARIAVESLTSHLRNPLHAAVIAYVGTTDASSQQAFHSEFSKSLAADQETLRKALRASLLGPRPATVEREALADAMLVLRTIENFPVPERDARPFFAAIDARVGAKLAPLAPHTRFDGDLRRFIVSAMNGFRSGEEAQAFSARFGEAMAAERATGFEAADSRTLNVELGWRKARSDEIPTPAREAAAWELRSARLANETYLMQAGAEAARSARYLKSLDGLRAAAAASIDMRQLIAETLPHLRQSALTLEVPLERITTNLVQPDREKLEAELNRRTELRLASMPGYLELTRLATRSASLRAAELSVTTPAKASDAGLLFAKVNRVERLSSLAAAARSADALLTALNTLVITESEPNVKPELPEPVTGPEWTDTVSKAFSQIQPLVEERLPSGLARARPALEQTWRDLSTDERTLLITTLRTYFEKNSSYLRFTLWQATQQDPFETRRLDGSLRPLDDVLMTQWEHMSILTSALAASYQSTQIETLVQQSELPDEVMNLLGALNQIRKPFQKKERGGAALESAEPKPRTLPSTAAGAASALMQALRSDFMENPEDFVLARGKLRSLMYTASPQEREAIERIFAEGAPLVESAFNANRTASLSRRRTNRVEIGRLDMNRLFKKSGATSYAEFFLDESKFASLLYRELGTNLAEIEGNVGASPAALNQYRKARVVDVTGAETPQVQGGGTCYFWATFNALSRSNPNLIDTLVKEVGPNAYAVQLHEPYLENDQLKFSDKPVTVTVNGSIPVDDDGTGLLGPKNVSVAPPKQVLLEKAFAKLLFGYEHIQHGGDALVVHGALTGRNGTRQAHRSMPWVPATTPSRVAFSQQKSAIEEVLRQGGGVVVESRHEEELLTSGILPSHAWSVQDVSEEGLVLHDSNRTTGNLRGSARFRAYNQGAVFVSWLELEQYFNAVVLMPPSRD